MTRPTSTLPPFLDSFTAAGHADAPQPDQWVEVSPQCWRAPVSAPGNAQRQIWLAVTMDERWLAVPGPATGPDHERQLLFGLHDQLAEAFFVETGRRAFCAGEHCRAHWPCPKREMWAFAGQRNGGQLHVPTRVAPMQPEVGGEPT